MRNLAFLLLSACAWQDAPPQPGAQTVVEYEYRGRAVSRQSLQRIDDRAWKRLQEKNQ